MIKSDSAACLVTGIKFMHYVCRMVAKVTRAEEQTDVVAIMYEPDNQFTAEEEACIRELLQPEV